MTHMRLIAAIVPPRHVLEELDSVVRSAGGDADPRVKSADGRHASDRRSLLDRLGSLGNRASSADLANDQLDTVDVTLMHIPVTYFGNLTLGDSINLADTLRSEVATWSRPELRFAGGAALEWTGDESVWAKLDGDVEKLVTIGRGIPRVVQKLQLYVDRRQFRPWLSVGTITDRTTAPYLEDLVARLDRFSGRSWTQETVTLLKNVPQEPDHPYEVVEELPLGD
jgi:RNA 2',3'-cyclic 3'-phosphodiesterase